MNDMAVYLYLTAMVFCAGACIGSFLNVCIYRIPLDQSVVRPGSHCPACNAPIAWYDNVPLVSYLVLRARCRKCGGRIAPRYLVVEFLTACLFLLVWLKAPPPGSEPLLGLVGVSSFWLVPVGWLAVSGLILGTFVDFDHMIIPDRVTIGGMVAGVALSALVPQLHGQQKWLGGMVHSLIGLVAGGGTLWLIAVVGRMIFRKDAMGMGDVKLLGAIGAFYGWRATLFSLMASSLVGAVVGLSLVALRRKAMGSRIPYGPYLALAAVVWILWGPNIWEFYMNLCTPAPEALL